MIIRDNTPLGICCDHAGFQTKEHLTAWLRAQQIEVKDFGTYSPDSVDYPDYAHPLATAVERGEVYPGIAICGSGNGIAMTLNKHQEIRAAICWTDEVAALTRAHNDANVLVLPGRIIVNETAEQITETFLSTPFDGGRHQLRIEKVPVK